MESRRRPAGSQGVNREVWWVFWWFRRQTDRRTEVFHEALADLLIFHRFLSSQSTLREYKFSKLGWKSIFKIGQSLAFQRKICLLPRCRHISCFQSLHFQVPEGDETISWCWLSSWRARRSICRTGRWMLQWTEASSILRFSFLMEILSKSWLTRPTTDYTLWAWWWKCLSPSSIRAHFPCHWLEW